jgi:hypothetical protein
MECPQCYRCWATFVTEKDWDDHVYYQQPRCSDNRHDIKRIESVTGTVFVEIKKAASMRGEKGADKPDPKTRWFTIYNLCFPPDKYWSFPPPTHPRKSLLPSSATRSKDFYSPSSRGVPGRAS